MYAQLKHEPQASLATIEILDFIGGCPELTVQGLQARLSEMGGLETIKVMIHSRGGSAIEGFGMYTLLTNHPARVEVDILGIAASAASLVACAGDKVRISENGYMMIHSAWISAAGNAEALRREADRLDKYKPGILSAYKRRMKLSEEQISAMLEANGGDGTWFTADMAVEAGLADEVYKAPPVRNSISFENLSGVPEGALLFAQEIEPEPEPEPEEKQQDPVPEPSMVALALDEYRNRRGSANMFRMARLALQKPATGRM